MYIFEQNYYSIDTYFDIVQSQPLSPEPDLTRYLVLGCRDETQFNVCLCSIEHIYSQSMRQVVGEFLRSDKGMCYPGSPGRPYPIEVDILKWLK